MENKNKNTNQYSSKLKAKIVLEHIKGKPTSELCNEYGIVKSTLYKWRDMFISNIEKPFEINDISKAQLKLKKENLKLKQIVAEQSLELKKNDEEFI